MIFSLFLGCGSNAVQASTKKRVMWGVLEKILDASKRMETKLDSLLAASNSNRQCKSPVEYPKEDITLISSFPLGMDEFVKLNEKIAENYSFRQHLVCVFC